MHHLPVLRDLWSVYSAVTLADGRMLLLVVRPGTGNWPEYAVYDRATGATSTPKKICTSATCSAYDDFFPLDRASAALLPDGRVILFGAKSRTNAGTLIYDPATDKLSSAGSSEPDGRAVSLADGRVLYVAASGPAAVYDPTTDTSATNGGLLTPRSGFAVTRLPDGRVLVSGGVAGNVARNEAEVYDPADGFFHSVGSLNVARRDHTATLLPNGRVLVAAGGSGDLTNEIASAELYNPVSKTWSIASPLPQPVRSQNAALLPTGHVLLSGGVSSGSPTTKTVLYDPTANTWRAGPQLSRPMQQPVSAFQRDGDLLIFGDDGGGYAWYYDSVNVDAYGDATVPDVPTSVNAGRGDLSALVSWTRPAWDGGIGATSYTVTSTPGNLTATVTGDKTSATVSGLTRGTSYTFRVTAVNDIGEGTASVASGTLTAATVPAAPTSVTASADNSLAQVRWSAPIDDGGAPLSGWYSVTAAPGGKTATASAGTTQATVYGLTNGVSYTFTVRAGNSIGAGPESTATSAVIPATVPGTPTNVRAQSGDSTATVSWDAPLSDGGHPVLGYTVTASPGGRTVDVAAPAISTTVDGLSNGTSYTFTVAAYNDRGTGTASEPSNCAVPGTPGCYPSAPRSVTAAAGPSSATITWSPPQDIAGSAIDHYTVVATPGGTQITVPGTADSATVTWLTPGQSYTFTVRATNATGAGPTSAASNAVAPYTVPGPPNSVTAAPGDSSATVSWTAPASNGGSPITAYRVTASPGGATTTVSGTTAVLGGLGNGTSYTFTVVAINDAGVGPASASSAAVVPRGLPGAPINVTATPCIGCATVTWTAGDPNGSTITGYIVTASPGGKTAIASGTAPSATVFGLTVGVTYTFTVKATNAAGTGPLSGPSNAVVPGEVPSMPSAVSAVGGIGSAQVTWKPSTSMNPILEYKVTASPGGRTVIVPGTATTAVVNGLTSGIFSYYTFTVAARSEFGWSHTSTPSAAVRVGGVPDAPANVTTVRGNASATVSWATPANNGDPISGYRLTWSPGGTTVTVGASSTSELVGGLSNGTSYTFTVRAINDFGTGPASAPSNAVTPATTPDAPVGPTASRGNSSATVTWQAPSSDSGSPITSYTVTDSPGGATTTVAGDTLTTTIAGLSNGTAYTFTVHATNELGDGRISVPSNAVVPATVPGTPTGVSAQAAGDGAATVTWTTPSSDGGSPITSYTVTSNPGGIKRTVTGTTATLTGLTNGTRYTFTVTATNATGSGPASTPSSSITPASQTALAAGSSTSALTYGRYVTLTVKLTKAGTTTPLPAQPVKLYLRKRGTTSWSYLATTTTNSTGVAAYSHRPAWNAEYMWRYDGTTAYRASASSMRTVAVAVAISATINRSSMPLGGTATFYGAVAPGHPGQYVYVQRYYSSAWHAVIRITLSSTSTWRYTVKPTSRGTSYYRIVKTADADHATGISATRTIKVY